MPGSASGGKWVVSGWHDASARNRRFHGTCAGKPGYKKAVEDGGGSIVMSLRSLSGTLAVLGHALPSQPVDCAVALNPQRFLTMAFPQCPVSVVRVPRFSLSPALGP